MKIARPVKTFLAAAVAFIALALTATGAAAAISVSLTSPTSNQTFGSPGTVTLTASATPSTGKTITKVEFFRGGTTLIATVTTSPYTFAWANPAPASYSLTAKVTDSGGSTKTSTAVSIKVLAPPTVNLTSPANGSSFQPGATISLAASASAASGASISKVQFFNGATLLGQDTTSPYTFSWTNVAAGNYTLTAVATDNKGGTATSTAANVTVVAPHTAPAVSITSPASGSITQSPANLVIAATATPFDGASITKVELYNGSALLATLTSSPYTYTWTGAPAGGHLLSAKATDSMGAVTTSALVYAIVDGPDTCDSSPPISARETATQLAAFGGLPLTFEENRGQTDSSVKFLARGVGYQLFLTPGASVVALRSPEGRQAALRMRFADGNAEPSLAGLDRTSGVVNYLLGKDPAAWHTHVANFARVRYESVYPGIDAVYHATQGKLEYDLHVAPNADPARIRLSFEGAESLSVDDRGDLLLRTHAGAVTQQKPVAYQDVGGERREVRASYRLLADNTVALDLGKYDHDTQLVIDPVLVYSTYLGGSNDASGASAIAVSRCGEALVTGWTWATDFPTTPGSFDAGPGDTHSRMGFVSKLNQSGTALIYSTYLSGVTYNTSNWTAQDTDLTSITVDSTGHVYVSGSTNASDFPVTPGVIMPSQPADPAGVVAKLTADGGALAFSTYMDGASVPSVAVDSSNNAYIAGQHQIRKLSLGATSFVYTTVVDTGFGSSDSVTAVAVDSSGDAYATGTTFSTFFPVTTGAWETTRPNSTSFPSGYVVKLGPTGTAVFSTFLGNTGTTQPTSIALDSSGKVYVAGLADGSGFPVVGGASHMFNMDLNQAGNRYAFAARLTADGAHLDYFAWVGGMFCVSGNQNCATAQSRANAIAVDSTGSAWIAGTTGSNRIPLTKPLNGTFAASGGDGFAIKLSPAGTVMTFGTLLNGTVVGTGSPEGITGSNTTGVQVDSIGSAYISGWTDKTDFPTTQNAFQTAPRSSITPNAYVTKINETKDTTTTLAASPSSANVGAPVTLTASITGNVPGGVVTFLDGGTSIGTGFVGGSSAQLVTSSLAGGTHSLTASYSGDAHNNPSNSSPISVSICNPTGQPSITMTGIADATTLVAGAGGTYTGASVSVTANAAAGNTLTSVTIYLDSSTFFWTPNSPSFAGSWNPIPALTQGLHTIYAAAVDNFGNTTVTPTARFIVNSATAAPPQVGITSPANGASFAAGDTITFAASATPQGSSTVTSVTYFKGATQLGSSSVAPYAVSWSTTAVGTYSMIAVAQDSTGALAFSAPVSFTVATPPPPASVTITSPADGSVFNGPTNIVITAQAVPAAGATIAKIDFFDGGTLIGTSTTGPFGITWTNASAGTHSVTARATDTRGASLTSSPISITMILPQPPTVSITSPLSGASFTVPAAVPVTATATASGGGTITRIELYAGIQLFASGTSGMWTVVKPGNYSLTAKAFASNGGVATSAPVTVTVNPAPDEVITFIHNDFAGNPIAATDIDGNVIWKESYTPFGQRLVNASASASSHQWFGGKIQDSTQLSYFGARYYDPAVGRFMAVDPSGFDEKNLTSFNRYAYGNNNPNRFIDRDGRIGIDLIFVAMDVYALATEGATTVNLVATGLDIASTFGLGFGAGQIFKGAVAAEHAVEIYRGSELARNMAEAGNGVAKGVEEAHHIVAQKAKAAEPARKILEEHGIDIHSAENGAAVEKSAHRGLHTNRYYEELNERLTQANQGKNARQNVGKVLEDYRNGLQSR
jgi:RHS repeat-associated protein